MTMTVFHLVSLKQGGACSVFYQGIFPKDFDARMEALVAILKLAAVGAMRVEAIPDICHGRHERRPCKFSLAGVNFYRFNAKN